jgi:hypothetical protein
MLTSLIDTLFGCSHRHTTFPLTPAKMRAGLRPAVPRVGTYVVCLDCGREFGYNWEAMQVGDPVAGRVPVTAAQPQFR